MINKFVNYIHSRRHRNTLLIISNICYRHKSMVTGGVQAKLIVIFRCLLPSLWKDIVLKTRKIFK